MSQVRYMPAPRGGASHGVRKADTRTLNQREVSQQENLSSPSYRTGVRMNIAKHHHKGIWTARVLVVGGTITQVLAWIWMLAGGRG